MRAFVAKRKKKTTESNEALLNHVRALRLSDLPFKRFAGARHRQPSTDNMPIYRIECNEWVHSMFKMMRVLCSYAVRSSNAIATICGRDKGKTTTSVYSYEFIWIFASVDNFPDNSGQNICENLSNVFFFFSSPEQMGKDGWSLVASKSSSNCIIQRWQNTRIHVVVCIDWTPFRWLYEFSTEIMARKLRIHGDK